MKKKLKINKPANSSRIVDVTTKGGKPRSITIASKHIEDSKPNKIKFPVGGVTGIDILNEMFTNPNLLSNEEKKAKNPFISFDYNIKPSETSTVMQRVFFGEQLKRSINAESEEDFEKRKAYFREQRAGLDITNSWFYEARNMSEEQMTALLKSNPITTGFIMTIKTPEWVEEVVKEAFKRAEHGCL
jgi:hypothetical protein